MNLEASLKVDKVCIRYRYDSSPGVPAEYDQLFQFKCSVMDGSFGSHGKVWCSKQAPMTSMHLPLGNGGGLLVKYGFVHQKHWSWIEFNPAKLSESDLCDIAGCLTMLFTDGFWTLLEKGSLARIDLALDLHDAEFGDYVFLDKRLRAACHKYDDLGSTYLGSVHGKKSTIVYDKAKEQLDKTGIVHSQPWLRVESRLYDPTKLKLGDIGNLDNPFITLLVVDRQALYASECNAVKSIQIALKQGVPLDQAYRQLPLPARHKAWEVLNSLRPEWWNPDAVWEGYQAKLDWIPVLCGLPQVETSTATH